MFTLTHQDTTTSVEVEALRGQILSIWDVGADRLVASSVALIAGVDALVVDECIERLMRTATNDRQSLAVTNALKLVPTVNRVDKLMPWDVLFTLSSLRHRIRGEVLQRGSRNPEIQIDLVTNFIGDCVAAWCYSFSGRANCVVIVELDDFCEHVGSVHVGALLHRLRLIARQFRLAIIAVAHTAGASMLSSTFSSSHLSTHAEAYSQLTPHDLAQPNDCELRPADVKQVQSPAKVTHISVTRRSRNPNARDLILEALMNSGHGRTPKDIAARLAGRDPSDSERANVRKLLQNMKRDGQVISHRGTYQAAGK